MGRIKVGLIQVYTGKGKGKTTAALGQALRACGQGLKVVVIQFLKGINTGELVASKKLPGLKIVQAGSRKHVLKKNANLKDRQMAEKGLRLAGEILGKNRCDILILDEINVAIDYGLLRIRDVISMIKKKPDNIELILTGRGAKKEIIDVADLVSDIKEVKHNYKKGISARRGIEY